MSFKRHVNPPSNTSTHGSKDLSLTSTGIPSLDDVLGGGLPLATTLTALCPNIHVNYGDLVQKYFIAQGLVSCHVILVIDPAEQNIFDKCMWFRPSSQTSAQEDLNNEKVDKGQDQDIQIAWRYLNLKQFQTTVNTDLKEHTFDLSYQIPASVIAAAKQSGRLSAYAPTTVVSDKYDWALNELAILLSKFEAVGIPIRVSVREVGSLAWGDHQSPRVLRFLHQLRALLRRSGNACALVTFAPILSRAHEDEPFWITKVASLSDGCVSFAGFAGDPAVKELSRDHHGLFHIHSLPSLYTLLSPSDKLSRLRGLEASGENNLGFKCTRKKLVIETLHLDAEGGVSERRTTNPSTPATKTSIHRATDNHGLPSVKLEIDSREHPVNLAATTPPPIPSESKRSKKSVVFQTDKPELYDY